MLLSLVIIVALIWAAVIGNIYSNFLVFYSNFAETENYNKAYLHHLFKTDEITAKILASIHNESFVVNTVDKIRESLLDDTFDNYFHDFIKRYYNNKN